MGTRPRWTLRRRLVVVVVALVAVVAAAMGTVSTLALHSSLITQLDEKLTAAHHRATDGPVRAGGLSGSPGQIFEPPAAGSGNFRPGQDAGTVNVEQPAGVDPADLTAFQAGYVGDDGTPTALTTEQATQMLAVPADGDVLVAVSYTHLTLPTN